MQMFKAVLRGVFALALALGLSSAVFARKPGVDLKDSLVILCYHDIADNLVGADPDVVSTAAFSAQMLWLKNNGYSVISMQDYVDFRNNKKSLPKKPVMVTFDDGYQSFYTHAFPILRSLKFPSTLGVIGSWANKPVPALGSLMSPGTNLAGKHLPILTRDQIKELSDSGLVEIASHSYDLHHGDVANTQGDFIPSASIQVLAKEYESNAAYSARLRTDLALNSMWLRATTGTAPRVMVWPYGRYTTEGLHAAVSTGHSFSFGLDETWFTYDQGEVLGRFYVTGNLKLDQFADYVKTAEDRIPARRHVSIQVPPGALEGDKVNAEWLKRLVVSVQDSGATVALVSPFLAEPSSCTALVATKATPQSRDVLSTVAWNLQRGDAHRVMLDLDLNRCNLSDAQWIELATNLLQLVPNQGLLVRVPPNKEHLAQELLYLAYSRNPMAMTASTAALPTQTFQLTQLNACSPDLTGVGGVNKNKQYEVDLTKCPGEPTLEQLLRRGIRDFGTLNPPVSVSGDLPGAAKYQLNGLVGFKP